ncbi:MAG: high-potential iron-sulfur protein [Myxococcota bacterium]|nr:high-potential iron-sulfur protein [Myxococcota bacterium]MDW8360846.1 high-potential iron-sulfur protein [Myxococcales bacterium]
MRSLGRRTWITGAAVVACGGLGRWLVGCSKPADGGALACTDTTGLTDQEKAIRAQLEYVDRSTVAGQNCANCRFWVPAPREGACGGCTLIRGPIHPEGHCKSWVTR